MTYSRWEVGGRVVRTSTVQYLGPWDADMAGGGARAVPRVHGHVYNLQHGGPHAVLVCFFCLNEGCGYTEDALPDALPGFLSDLEQVPSQDVEVTAGAGLTVTSISAISDL